jgi:hypothetical protein
MQFLRATSRGCCDLSALPALVWAVTPSAGVPTRIHVLAGAGRAGQRSTPLAPQVSVPGDDDGLAEAVTPAGLRLDAGVRADANPPVTQTVPLSVYRALRRGAAAPPANRPPPAATRCRMNRYDRGERL